MIDVLVADSGAFLRVCSLHEMAARVVTAPEVIAEIRDRTTRERLQVLPYELEVKTPSEYHQRCVRQFARMTGDYRHLSATDINVLALTRQLTVELNGGSEAGINSKPPGGDIKGGSGVPQVVVYHPKQKRNQEGSSSALPVGFVEAGVQALRLDSGGDSASDEDDDDDDDGDVTAHQRLELEKSGSVKDSIGGEDCQHQQRTDRFAETRDLDVKEAGGGDLDAGGIQTEESVRVQEEEEQEVDDDAGWITPENLAMSRMKMMEQAGQESVPLKVACLTTDFSMQNVLKQMSLEIVSVEGRRIREARRFILRCFGCYQTTPRVDTVFCPSCGHKTLKRVAVTVNDDGTQVIHISSRRPISTRGTIFSLPKHRGGKFAVNPILRADQPMPQLRISKRAQARNAIVTDDYVCGDSPFAARDVTSRSAQLGLTNRAASRHWQQRNPNRVAPPTGNRRKRRH